MNCDGPCTPSWILLVLKGEYTGPGRRAVPPFCQCTVFQHLQLGQGIGEGVQLSLEHVLSMTHGHTAP